METLIFVGFMYDLICILYNIIQIFVSFSFLMSTQAVDTTDAIGVESLVFQGDQSERSSWKFCNSTTLPRSEVVFFFQALILLILIIAVLVKLLFYEVPCEEMPFWVSLLSAAVGYILPNPRL